MAFEPPQKLLYITSRGHSGSTLTEMLIGAHSRAVSAGELRMLGTERESGCRCGVASIAACPFWQQVEARLQGSRGIGLRALSLEDPDAAIFAEDNRALVEAIAEVSGADWVVDASKNLDRLENLIRADCFDLRILHLTRSPYGVVYSNVKRGRDWLAHARNYTIALMRTRALLKDRSVIELRYERLARAPERELRRLMPSLGADYEAGQLEWAAQDIHTFAGNAMRKTRDSTIRVDTAWRRGLTLRQILGITWWTLPTRFPGTRLFDDHRPYWKGEGKDAWREFRKKRRGRIRTARRRRWRQNRLISRASSPLRRLWRRISGGASS